MSRAWPKRMLAPLFSGYPVGLLCYMRIPSHDPGAVYGAEENRCRLVILVCWTDKKKISSAVWQSKQTVVL